MSDTDDSPSVPEGAVSVAEGQQATRTEEVMTGTGLAVADQPDVDQAHWTGQDLDLEGVQLLSRFLMGAAILGGDELIQRLRQFQKEIEAEPWRLSGDDDLGQESTTALLRYLAIGLYARGQKRVARGVRRGFRFALGTTGWALGGVDRLTNNRLTRPLRQTVSVRMRSLGEEAVQIIEEGKREEQNARLLAGRTVNEIIDEVVDYVAENPDMQASIRHVISQQGVGLANVVADNARLVSASADDFTEGIVRRILMRKSRRELPPSPLAGKPQTMYLPESPEQLEVGDGN
jgi:hypothetical protein